MVEPQIRFAHTSDGVNIAYYAVGDGVPFISMPVFPACHLQAIRQVPAARALDDGVVATGGMHVRYDPRGFGLSDRDIATFDLDAMVADLHAVIERLGGRRVILYGIAWACTIQVAYAARYPEFVSRLVIQSGTASGVDAHTGALEALIALASSNWQMFTNTIMNVALGWTSEDEAGQWAVVIRESVTPETFLQFMRDQRAWDATDLLPGIKTPSLVFHQRDYALVSMDAVRRLAAGLPNAELIVLNGDRAALGEEGVNAMLAFLGADRGAQWPTVIGAPELAGSGSAVILFTDIVDSTALTERMGDARFRELSRALDGGLRAAIREAGGSAVEGKLLGDGVLATFGSAAQAIDGARRCLALSAASELGLHIGLHAGDVIREEVDGRRDVFGGAVNIAARICGLSAPGEILVSDVVRGMARSSAGVVFEDRGEQEMKGVGEAVRVYAVVMQE